MKLSCIVAVDRDGGIGKDGKMPWPKLPRDMARFKSLTMGHPVIMGRKTWESIGRPLPGRQMIVVSHSLPLEGMAATVSVARDIPMALDMAAQWGKEAFVGGGGELYQQLLPRCERLFMTMIGGTFDCDTFFYEGEEWVGKGMDAHQADERNQVGMVFIDMVRPEGWSR